VSGRFSLHRGVAAERRAARFLRRQGLKLRTANYRTRRGEIDLVMEDGATLVFVEVRQRSSLRYGDGAESISAAKRRRITAAASQFCQHHGTDCPCRFDVVSIDAEGGVDWIRDAFEAETGAAR